MLETTIDGDPINPSAFIAGRQEVGGADVPLDSEEARAAATAFGASPRAVKSLGGDVGRLNAKEDYLTGAGYKDFDLQYLESLTPQQQYTGINHGSGIFVKVR